MATATYTPTLSSVGLNKIWRKVQGKLQTGLQFASEEWGLLPKLNNFEIDWSAREITVPIDIIEGYGVASIAEGGFEGRPSSPNVQEITFTWTLFNKRFSATKTAMYIDQNNPEAELKKQLLYQGMKAIQDLGRHVSDYFYGFGTAVLARNTTVATQASGAYTLADLYGVSGLGSAAIIADKFRVGDYVALTQAGALVANAIGVITAISKTTPSITVTWNGSVTSANTNLVVKANSTENTTLAGTDYNQGITGLLDMLTSASVHGLSSGTEPNWVTGYSDTTSSRFSGIKLHRAKDEMWNIGGGSPKQVIIAQGVYRDLLALQQAALRFNDPFALEIDGDVKSKGINFFKTRRVPNGMVILFDPKSVNRMTLLPEPGEKFSWDEGYKLQDQSGFLFSVDWPVQMIVTNRRNTVYFQNQTEQ
jgi:hypothetical protein